MAYRVEVRFIDQSDFVNKGNGFLLKGSPDWELDSTISLEMSDLLDDISVYLFIYLFIDSYNVQGRKQ